MRMRRLLLIASASVVVGLSAAVPIWASRPPAPAASPTPELVPAELYGALVSECDGDNAAPPGQVMFPTMGSGRHGDRIRFALYEVDEGDGRELTPIAPSGELAERLAAMNECLAPYELASWTEPPRIDEFHRNIYYDYFSGVLVPCLTARGSQAAVPARADFERLDVAVWYQRRIELLAFDEALETWRNCPLVPPYLEDAIRRARVSDPAP